MDDCIICLDQHIEKDIYKTKCNHIIGLACLLKWIDIQQASTCPYCRSKLDVDIIRSEAIFRMNMNGDEKLTHEELLKMDGIDESFGSVNIFNIEEFKFTNKMNSLFIRNQRGVYGSLCMHEDNKQVLLKFGDINYNQIDFMNAISIGINRINK